jgi:hypothetical protein
MRKHPLIALTAFTALAASAIAGASTGTFQSSVLSSDRAERPSPALVRHAMDDTYTSIRTVATFSATAPDVRLLHDYARPARLRLVNRTGLAVIIRVHHATRHVTAPSHQTITAPPVTTVVPTTTTTPTTTPAPPPVSTPSTAPAGGVWYELRMCESGDNYSINTGNGYYGAYQFSLATWYGLGFSGLPSDAPPAVQDRAAQELQAEAGWGQWPACSAQLGL